MAHVLLLEPNTLLSKVYTQMFTRVGHTVAVAHGSQEAIHMADQQLPGVVVLELQLPVHNGIEFLHEFRSYPEWQQVPVIVHTMLPVSRIRAHAPVLRDAMGVGAVLYKPATTLTDLCRVIAEAVGAA